ncbi:MAG: FGGY-family carbohydrate kinase [Acutalibacteraceae bacterium]|nr:FGGY-family carbohydrate kinase [Acutalibacteraceae bacterium]
MGKLYLGIEFGSTRIKGCLIDEKYNVVSTGGYQWENKFENGYWTYSLDEIHKGLKECFADLKKNTEEKTGKPLTQVTSMGISGMMHGFLAFDKDGNLLTEFRTWRNTTCAQASKELTEAFGFNVPQRWSIAHLYQAILNNEPYVEKIAYITTLSGYIHYLLTGKREMGIGEASGMFPIKDNDYDADMLSQFRELTKGKLTSDIYDILPKVKVAGQQGTLLSDEGAKLLDVTGTFKAGIPVCAPEGDAGTGMVATNAVLRSTGNVSAGTSVFAMLVLNKPLSRVYPEIDVVTTPDGSPVAMVHCNNCCGELDAWVNVFEEFALLAGLKLSKGDIYGMLYKNTENAKADCGDITAYNYLSGEHITGIEQGSPMYFRKGSGKLTLADFMKAQLYSAISSLSIGMEILFEKENAKADKFLAHGGLFKVEGVAQQILSDALSTPVSVMETAGEGGAWGMALLAAYMDDKQNLSLGDWLEAKVFANMNTLTKHPADEGVKGFKEYIKRYKAGLKAEKSLEEVF